MASTLVTPYLIWEPFGAAAANPTYINLPIPVPSQIGTTVNAASFTDGFPPNTMTPEASGGLPFFGQDMNGILYMISAYCANFAAGALPTYNATLSSNVSGYPVGVVLVNATGSGLWVNSVSGNTTDPDTGGAGWTPLATTGESNPVLTSGTITLTPAQYTVPLIGFSGTLTGNVTVIFPENLGQAWVVNNGTTGAFTVTLTTTSAISSIVLIAGSGYSAAQNVFIGGSGAGLGIYSNNVSTAGLAPLASPAFTGIPTAPTAAASTNTTQIATTAMVQAAITAGLVGYAPLASPIFTGTPTVPTAAFGTNNTQAASTAFIQQALFGYAVSSFSTGSNANGFWVLFGGSVLVQYGYNSTGGGTTSTQNFPIPFPTVCDVILLSPIGGNATLHASLPSASKTGFQLTNGAAGVGTSWLAIGS